jgi:hypothetical protein
MNFLFIISAITAINVCTYATKLGITETIKTDTVPKLINGFYLAVADSSKSLGFKVYNEDHYYFLS